MDLHIGQGGTDGDVLIDSSFSDRMPFRSDGFAERKSDKACGIFSYSHTYIMLIIMYEYDFRWPHVQSSQENMNKIFPFF